VVSWVPQNGFVGRVANGDPDGPGVATRRFTAFGRLSFNPGQVEFSLAKLDTGAPDER
jgi:hypothetical protein